MASTIQLTLGSLWLIWFVLVCCLEFDRMTFADAFQRSRFLEKDLSHRLIMEAGCSSDTDAWDLIQYFVGLQEVEEAVAVLLRMNIFTRELHRTAALTGELGDMSTFSRFWVAGALVWWSLFPLLLRGTSTTVMIDILIAVMPAQAICWLILAWLLPQDRRAFAASTLKLWLLLVFLNISWIVDSGRSFVPWYLYAGSLVLGPSCLALSLAGPLRLARLPVLGVPLVRLLIGKKVFCRRREQRDRAGFPTALVCLEVNKMKTCAREMIDVDDEMIPSCFTNYSGNELGCLPNQVRKTGEWHLEFLFGAVQPVLSAPRSIIFRTAFEQGREEEPPDDQGKDDTERASTASEA
eukprot:s132_g6.t3